MGSSFSATNLYGNHYHSIHPKLYIGDKYSIYEKFFSSQQKLLVINATNYVKFNNKLHSINIRVPVDDDLSDNAINIMFDNLDKITDIIDKHLKNGYVVLVHCVAGRQRSCAIVAGYLMKYHKLQQKEAIGFIKKKRPFAFFMNVNFKRSLIKFARILH